MINGSLLLILSTVIFLGGYLFYGRYLAKKLRLDNKVKTLLDRPVRGEEKKGTVSRTRYFI